MTDKLDQDLDELLSRHFHACLDGQLGRASASLADELSPKWRWRLWLAAGTAVAAGLTVAIMMIVHDTRPAEIVMPTSPTPAIVAQVPPMLQSASWSKMTDEGTTFVADRPMRKLGRKVVEEVEWYDAKNRAMVKTTLPQQQIYLIEMKTD